MGALRCYFCGKFVPYAAYYSWNFYGGYEDTEPPDPLFAHVDCFEQEAGSGFENICWIKPHKYIYD